VRVALCEMREHGWIEKSRRFFVDRCEMGDILPARSKGRGIESENGKSFEKKPLTDSRVELLCSPARKRAKAEQKSWQKIKKSVDERKSSATFETPAEKGRDSLRKRGSSADDWDFKLNSTLSRRLKGAKAVVGNDRGQSKI
jgi:hypothetical protein